VRVSPCEARHGLGGSGAVHHYPARDGSLTAAGGASVFIRSMSDENAALLRRRYRVSGRVQGVGFRAWAVRRARELPVRGLIRNASDGTVEVEAEGAADAIRRLEELLRRGPALARVQGVTRLEPTEDGLPDGFDVAW
jgi:acylphosphatase